MCSENILNTVISIRSKRLNYLHLGVYNFILYKECNYLYKLYYIHMEVFDRLKAGFPTNICRL